MTAHVILHCTIASSLWSNLYGKAKIFLAIPRTCKDFLMEICMFRLGKENQMVGNLLSQTLRLIMNDMVI